MNIVVCIVVFERITHIFWFKNYDLQYSTSIDKSLQDDFDALFQAKAQYTNGDKASKISQTST